VLAIAGESQTVANLSDAAEGNGQAWIVANSAGQIWFETGKAVDWLKERERILSAGSGGKRGP
jgi:hypothetical protein